MRSRRLQLQWRALRCHHPRSVHTPRTCLHKSAVPYQAQRIGPRAKAELALQKLQGFVESCRINALLGSCPRSHVSFESGVATWTHFAGKILGKTGKEFPPTADDLVAWSAHFNVAGTFTNYLGYVRLACQILGASDAAFSSPALLRAKTSILKRDEYRRRDPMFVRQALLARMVEMARGARSQEGWAMTMLYVTTYAFMLRLQSEALPIAVNKVAPGHVGQQAIMTLEGDEVVLRLERRKNWQQGSVIRRSCWCCTCKQTCPVHAVWKFMSGFPDGAQPCAAVKYKDALLTLRASMAILGEKGYSRFGAQDLRRGHA